MANATIYSGSNVYVPNLEGSGNLVINYSRNESRFPINKWAALKKVNKSVGLYGTIRPAENSRVTSLAQFVWPDGSPGNARGADWNNLSYTLDEYRTTRIKVDYSLDQKTVDQASFGIVEGHAGMAASVAMTLRTKRALDLLTNTSNWPAASQISPAGTWSSSTVAQGYIRQTFQDAIVAIKKATNSAVQNTDLMVVVSPDVAYLMANAPEIVDFVKGSPYVYDYMKGGGQFSAYGLPPEYAGIKIVVEDTVYTSSKRELTAVQSFVEGGTFAVIVSKPDALVNDYIPSPSYNTFTIMAYEEFTLEQQYDSEGRQYWGRVVEDSAMVLTAPASGAIISSIS